VPVERLDRYAGFRGDPVHRAFRIAILKERPQRMTPATFGSMLRMDLSIQSVSQQEMALQDVALNLGFDSPGNFTRFFVRPQGVTPSQYRHNVQFVSGAGR
jgi:AraC-like DNA-binding protein